MRQHIEHLLAALAAVGIALFISYFNTGPVLHTSPSKQASGKLIPLPSEDASLATTSLPTFTISTTTLDALFPAIPPQPPSKKVVATSTPAKPVVLAPKKSPTLVVPVIVIPTPKVVTPSPTTTLNPPPAPPAAVATTTTPAPSSSSDTLKTLSESIVNIICIAHDGTLRSISGSGVIIDSRGLILTVAHVAQSTLLQEYRGTDKVSCTVRTGSPAKSMYTARPVYVSEAWLKANSTTLISSQPTGTGEHDYAVLAITGSVTNAPLPGAFPAVALNITPPKIGDTVYIGTYGAQGLTSAQVRSELYPTLVSSTVQDRYTFDSNTVDVLAIAGSAASQTGSSGGAVVNSSGELVGMVTTSETSGPVASREMRSISTNYILRSYEAETGKDFATYFGSTGFTTLINVYAPTAHTLGEFLAHAIGLQ